MDRQNFLHLTGASLTCLLVSDFTRAEGKKNHKLQMPDEVKILSGSDYLSLRSSDKVKWEYKDVFVELKTLSDKISVSVQSRTIPLKEIRLSWKYPFQNNTKVLGDHWERTYGDVGWQSVSSTKKLPWYCIDHNDQDTTCFGVKTGCHAICYWEVAESGLQLTLDTRTGGNGVALGDKTLHAGDIVTTKNEGDENVFATTHRFCKQMCDQPRLPASPVYGINDWYFAYGNNSADLILQHTSLLASLASNTSNLPFSVVDAGWAVKSPLLSNDCCWGDDFTVPNKKFGDMQQLALNIKKLGMRPGLWTRPLSAKHDDNPHLLMPFIEGRDDKSTPLLDPTIDENIQRIKNMIRVYKQWGYELVKHDYTSFDIFGRWGFQMNDAMTAAGWQFNDNTRTNAEIILDLYKGIREAAGDMYLIGCNTMSHLSAGLFELNRIGDDTSGKEWARTRKMGVNTLGFRMVQHRSFYEADGDCVGLTNEIPWAKNKQWMQLVSQSGTPLFISAQPDALGSEQRSFIKQSFADASKKQELAEPIDWLSNSLPAKWKLDGRIINFDWS